MSMIALYVYAPMTFRTDSRIEPMEGPPISAGEVTLQPGIYRLAGDAVLIPAAVPNGESNYLVIKLENTKGARPEPPISPIAGYTMNEIVAFFDGAGGENEI